MAEKKFTSAERVEMRVGLIRFLVSDDPELAKLAQKFSDLLEDYAALEQKAEAIGKALERRLDEESSHRHCANCPECKIYREDREALRQWRER